MIGYLLPIILCVVNSRTISAQDVWACYCKQGKICWAKLLRFSRVLWKFIREYLFVLYMYASFV